MSQFGFSIPPRTLINDLGNKDNQQRGSASTTTDTRNELDYFQLLAVLGRGGFGKVMQVRHDTTNCVYAMKIIKKSNLNKRQVERIAAERHILEVGGTHPFIVSLAFAFQTRYKLYLVS